MNIFDIKPEDKVLLLGEGNFSFSRELVNNLKKFGFENFTNFYSTCLETEENSNITEDNREFLINQGVQILFGVDATKLSNHELLSIGQFQRILFNFPHVGGKMRLDLNRLLLKNFFTSVAQSGILSKDGLLLVSLCAGQGGTSADTKPRKWCDTWQVTEMAAFGNFALKKIKNFPHELFPEYVSTGFRGTVRSFHTEGSLVHIFKENPTLLPLNLEQTFLSGFHDYHPIDEDDLEVTLEYKNAFDNNPLKRSESPQSFLVNCLLNKIKEVSKLDEFKEKLPLYINEDSSKNHAICTVNKEQFYLRKSLFEILPENKNLIDVYVKGIVFNEVTELSISPAECQLLISSPCCKEIFKLIDSYLIETFRIDSFESIICTHSDSSFSINLDKLCLLIYNLENWRQIWTSDCKIEEGAFVPTIVHSQPYEFDVSFGTNLPCNETILSVFISRLPGSIINSVHLLSTFSPEDRPLTYYCYRIKYVSYEYPVYRSRVVDYHKNILCKALIKLLKVDIQL